MKLFERYAPAVKEYRADQVQEGWRLAPGRFQCFLMGNVARGGEEIVEVAYDLEEGLVYVTGDLAGWAWTLAPDQTVVIEKESVT